MDGNYFYIKTTTQGHKLKVGQEILSKEFATGRYEFSDSKINISLSNKTRTMMADVNLLRENFDDYVCEGTLPIVIDMREVFESVRHIKKTTSLSFSMKKNNDRELVICKDGISESKISVQNVQSFRYMPPQQYEHPVVLKSTLYQQMCKDLNAAKGNITFKIEYEPKMENNALVAYRTIGIRVERFPLGVYRGTETSYSQTFTGAYLNVLNKIPAISEKVRIYIGKDLPLRIGCSMASLGQADWYIKSNEMIRQETIQASGDTTVIEYNDHDDIGSGSDA
jgi:hypothetical protein